VDKELLAACISISLGRENKAKFWHDRWLQERAPCDIAPQIYNQAWRKNHNVREGLSNGRWMRRIYNSTQGNDPVN
jgi:hypothetical protein